MPTIANETPEFVAYALGRSCALRGGKHPLNPLETERQLRALRAYCEAISDDRVWDGICIAPEPTLDAGAVPLAFRVDDMLAAYGGLPRIVAECQECPACAIRSPLAPPIAGCFGCLALSTLPDILSPDSFAIRFDDVLQQPALRDEVAREFVGTQPAWYGLWTESPLRPTQLEVHSKIARCLAERTPHAPHAGLLSWCATLTNAIEHRLELHVTLVPRGVIAGRSWTIVPHCSRCHAERVDKTRCCPICAHTAAPQAARTRCARGDRPFQPLDLLLGKQAAQEFMEHRRHNT